MKIYNTLTRQKEELVTLEPGVARIYACGPTVYNFIRTCQPLHSRYRRSTSKTHRGRALPMWMKLYTVGPQA